jgi:signal transduction histidine kinase
MTTAVPGGDAGGVRVRRGVGGSLLALARAIALLGPLLLGAVLLVVIAGSVALTVQALGHMVQDLLNHRSLGMGNGELGQYLEQVVIGLLACYFVLPVALLATRRLAMATRRLSARWCGAPIPSAYRPRPAGLGWPDYQRRMSWLLSDEGTWRDLAWLVVNACAGLVLLAVPLTLVGVGIVAFIIPAVDTVPASYGLQHLVPPSAFPGNTPLALFVIGLAFTALGLWTAPLLLRGYGGLARLVLAPSGHAELERRVRHLDQTRRETLHTGAAELRRIERDLHDGAQARLVAMGLTLDAAGRLIDTDPAAARALLIEARDASAKALSELRDLVRGIHPPVLADRGLTEAIRALALDSPLRVQVTGQLDGRVPAPVESAAYFAVSELLANVVKHSGAQRAEVDVRHSSGALRISVSDDGAGGADPSRGTGLPGIGRRLSAFDGVLVVSSPAGGPTMITMEVPCALS